MPKFMLWNLVTKEVEHMAYLGGKALGKKSWGALHGC